MGGLSDCGSLLVGGTLTDKFPFRSEDKAVLPYDRCMLPVRSFIAHPPLKERPFFSSAIPPPHPLYCGGPLPTAPLCAHTHSPTPGHESTTCSPLPGANPLLCSKSCSQSSILGTKAMARALSMKGGRGGVRKELLWGTSL